MEPLPLIMVFVIFYFLLIRPQQKKAKFNKLDAEVQDPRESAAHADDGNYSKEEKPGLNSEL